MTAHRFAPTHYHNTIGSHDPVLRIADGDTVLTQTVDAAGCDASGSQITEPGNPQTGPFYVEGAEPDDTLSVHLDVLRPNRSTGFSQTALAPSVVDPRAIQYLPENQIAAWSIDTDRGSATMLAPRLSNMLTVPLAPMLGCFGVAPPRCQAISTATSGPYGGNMDYRHFQSGATVYFPVFTEGALFHLGDGHALQGDGELLGTGIETSFDVQFTVRLIKSRRQERPQEWPRGENAEYVFTVGNGRPLDQALQFATTEMGVWLVQDFGWETAGLGSARAMRRI